MVTSTQAQEHDKLADPLILVEEMLSQNGIQYCHLEGDKVPPNPRPVRGLDVLVKVVQDNVIDVLIPSQDFSYFCNLALSDLNPGRIE